MMKLLVQLGLVISCAILFSGCSKEASVPAEAEKDPTFDPLPQGLPVFVDIDEAFIADSQEGDGRSALFSYQLPEDAQDASEIKEILSADSRLIISLNTVAASVGSEVTLLVRNDSVYSVNHLSNQIRLLSHFTNTVCELIPRERVETTPGQSPAPDKRLTVLHDELVYVMTAEGSCTGEGKKRFYALPLDHQLDPTQDADGELNSLDLVNESLARAKLMFAWEDAEDGKQLLTYGFLGYGVEEPNSTSKKPALVLYDEQREAIWRQERNIEKFPVVQVAPEQTSQAYLFHVQALENQHYLIQLGLDVFVVDSGEALFAKAFNQTDDILSDRALKLSPKLFNSTSDDAEPIEIALPVATLFDNDDLLVFDESKIFYQAYQAQTPIRNPLESYEIVDQNPTNIDSREFADRRYFSQFDLKACGEDLACVAAHDVAAQDWQLITDCEAALGCTLNNQVENFCETLDEKRVSQSNETLCTASDYRHLSELNTPANDMTFKGFTQYGDYTRQRHLILENNRLYIIVQMHEKELLLRYNYALDFSAPKSQREQVLFGKNARVFGLDAHFVDNNLFLTALTESAVRSNECYKDYQRVACNLGELLATGGVESCTGKDLKEGLCINRFQEYESRALFCSSAQLQDLSCSDTYLGQVSDLAVETSDQDAKWLGLIDYTPSAPPVLKMHLLIGDNQQALNEQKLDEGRLLDPQIFDVDTESGQPIDSLGVLEGTVEQALSGWVKKEVADEEVAVLAHLTVISEDILSSASQQQKTELVHFLLEQSYLNATSYALRAQKVAVSVFNRP